MDLLLSAYRCLHMQVLQFLRCSMQDIIIGKSVFSKSLTLPFAHRTRSGQAFPHPAFRTTIMSPLQCDSRHCLTHRFIDIEKEDVRKERRDHCSLRCRLFCLGRQAIFQGHGLQPFDNQPDNTLVTDPVLKKTYHLFSGLGSNGRFSASPHTLSAVVGCHLYYGIISYEALIPRVF